PLPKGFVQARRRTSPRASYNYGHRTLQSDCREGYSGCVEYWILLFLHSFLPISDWLTVRAVLLQSIASLRQLCKSPPVAHGRVPVVTDAGQSTLFDNYPVAGLRPD